MISAVGRSYKILSGLVGTTRIPQNLTCIHCLSSFISTDILCPVPSHSFLLLSISSGSAHLHPASLHYTPFSHICASQHITQRYSPPIDTCPWPSVSQGNFLFQTLSVQLFLCSLSLNYPPSHPRSPKDRRFVFAAMPSRARCRPMFEWGGSGHRAAPAQGCSAHKALHQWPESEHEHLPHCPPGQGTNSLCGVQRASDSCYLGQVLLTREEPRLKEAVCFFPAQSGEKVNWICTYSEGQRAKNNQEQ